MDAPARAAALDVAFLVMGSVNRSKTVHVHLVIVDESFRHHRQ
jgi:hypothetical protein